jgi:hypothetical protein
VSAITEKELMMRQRFQDDSKAELMFLRETVRNLESASEQNARIGNVPYISPTFKVPIQLLYNIILILYLAELMEAQFNKEKSLNTEIQLNRQLKIQIAESESKRLLLERRFEEIEERNLSVADHYQAKITYAH